jgi:hypothetical protein
MDLGNGRGANLELDHRHFIGNILAVVNRNVPCRFGLQEYHLS